ncbi:hypothetical protein [Anaerosporobacter sp.]|uniref:hypothetical protein n=1 Tax=Anaerosporobacter sp. TaxID=1872529 RepID=UPI00286EF7DF|nr:hypothetical protein [Anaerosporobacter sp.]
MNLEQVRNQYQRYPMFQLENSEEFLTTIIEEQFKDSMNAFFIDYKKTKQVHRAEFLRVIENLLQKGIKKQEAGKKGKIAYICIFFLESAVMTGSYQMQIQMYDKNLYFDRNEVSSRWDTSFIMKYYEKDIEELDKKAKKRIYYWRYKEYQKMKLEYAKAYKAIVEVYGMELIRELFELELYKKLEREEDIKVLYGGYLEKLHTIYPMEMLNETGGRTCSTF